MAHWQITKNIGLLPGLLAFLVLGGLEEHHLLARFRGRSVDDFQLGALVAPNFLVGGVEDAQGEAGEEQRDKRRVEPQAAGARRHG